jgi:hypothetical protein
LAPCPRARNDQSGRFRNLDFRARNFHIPGRNLESFERAVRSRRDRRSRWSRFLAQALVPNASGSDALGTDVTSRMGAGRAVEVLVWS